MLYPIELRALILFASQVGRPSASGRGPLPMSHGPYRGRKPTPTKIPFPAESANLSKSHADGQSGTLVSWEREMLGLLVLQRDQQIQPCRPLCGQPCGGNDYDQAGAETDGQQQRMQAEFHRMAQ